MIQGGEIEIHATLSKRAQDRKSGALFGVVFAGLFAVVGFALLDMNWPCWMKVSVVCVGVVLGAVIGLLLGRESDRAMRRDRAQRSEEARATQEIEFQRKLAEAKAKGEI